MGAICWAEVMGGMEMGLASKACRFVKDGFWIVLEDETLFPDLFEFGVPFAEAGPLGGIHSWRKGRKGSEESFVWGIAR